MLGSTFDNTGHDVKAKLPAVRCACITRPISNCVPSNQKQSLYLITCHDLMTFRLPHCVNGKNTSCSFSNTMCLIQQKQHLWDLEGVEGRGREVSLE